MPKKAIFLIHKTGTSKLGTCAYESFYEKRKTKRGGKMGRPLRGLPQSRNVNFSNLQN